MILSFDTSNYTTSACLFDATQGIIWQNRILLHPPENRCGLRQSDVVFLHTKNFETILDGMPHEKIDAVVASARPRALEGSYMPCFLVGKHFAKSLANVLGCTFKTFSHQENHIFAALYSSGYMNLLKAPFIVFHISGGTSDVLMVKPSKDGVDIEQIGTSNDLHAGQLIDRIGVRLGLQFPCGKEVEKLAQQSTQNFAIKTAVRDFTFHFSGFENKAVDLINNKVQAPHVAKFALDAVLETIADVILNLNSKYDSTPILLAGGVMSNQYIASKLKEKYDNLFFSDAFYSSDHALGNAVLYNFLSQK